MSEQDDLKPRNLKIAMNLENIPTPIFTNFAQCRPGIEEILLLLGVRDDFNATFSEDKEDVSIIAYPVLQIAMGPAFALQLAGILTEQANALMQAVEVSRSNKAEVVE